MPLPQTSVASHTEAEVRRDFQKKLEEHERRVRILRKTFCLFGLLDRFGEKHDVVVAVEHQNVDLVRLCWFRHIRCTDGSHHYGKAIATVYGERVWPVPCTDIVLNRPECCDVIV